MNPQPKIRALLKEVERRIDLRLQTNFNGQITLNLEVNFSQGGIGESYIEEKTRARLKLR